MHVEERAGEIVFLFIAELLLTLVTVARQNLFLCDDNDLVFVRFIVMSSCWFFFFFL